MPESVTDRPTSAWEHVFLLSKSARYYYDADAVREIAIEGTDIGLLRGRSFESPDFLSAHAPSIARRIAEGVDSLTAGTGTRNMWNYWLLGPEPFPEAHFAVYLTEIPRRAILAGSREGDTVLDPFSGSGTTGVVALRHGRRYVGIELSEEYVAMSRRRIVGDAPLWNTL